MKVMLVNGSSRENGTTMAAINEAVRIFKEEGVEAEIIQLGKEPISDCLQCNFCVKNGRCVIDDEVNRFVEKAESADGFIFASPVYYAHPSGRLYTFLDRVFFSSGCKDKYAAFRFKPGAAIAVARRAGTTATLDGINKFFGISQMPVAGSTYWNGVHGLRADDAPKDEEGMQTVRNLARNMIWMMRCFEAGRKAGIPCPDSETGAMTNFIKRG